MKKILSAFLLIAIILLPKLSFAQTTGVVYGFVRNTQGSGVAGVRVFIRAGGQDFQETTVSSGYYTFQAPEGLQDVYVDENTLPSNATVSSNPSRITVDSNSPKQVNFTVNVVARSPRPTPVQTPIPTPTSTTSSTCQTDCSKCPTTTTCGTKTYDTCKDDKGQFNSSSSFCQNGASKFRCFANDNTNCTSSSQGTLNEYNYSCSACYTGSPAPKPSSSTPPLTTAYSFSIHSTINCSISKSF